MLGCVGGVGGPHESRLPPLPRKRPSKGRKSRPGYPDPTRLSDASESLTVFLLSPTEHNLRKILEQESLPYRNSSLCEANGVDVIVKSTRGLVGYQRKTIPDLKASLIDGRLFRELAQLKTSPIVTYPFVVIEHNPRTFTTSGTFSTTDFPISTYTSVITKIQLVGVHVLNSSSTKDTIRIIQDSSFYLSSANATTLRRAGPDRNTWGKRTNSDYLAYFLQSFPGVGPKLAGSIVSYFNGSLPLVWVVDESELTNIPGIGPSLAHKLHSFFNPQLDMTTTT